MYKKLSYKLHLWLGLSTGIIVLFVSLTGCILCFEDEIKSYTEPYNFVGKRQERFLLPSELIPIASRAVPAAGVSTMKTRIDYRGENLSVVVLFFNAGKLYSVYVNPYTGKVLQVKNLSKDFFRIIRAGHRTLWLGAAGKIINGTAVIMFLILLVTGLILWFPRRWSKTNIRKSLSIKWGAGFKRLNYDLHNVPGFYVFIIVFMLGVSGLMISFKWVNESVYRMAALGKPYPKVMAVQSDTTRAAVSRPDKSEDRLLIRLYKAYGKGREINVSLFPVTQPAEPLWAIINAGHTESIADAESRYGREQRYFDQYTLRELKNGDIENSPLTDAPFGEKVIRINYDLHTGRVGGIYTKILAFCASLIAASLPVTGFMIWKGRKKKKR